MVGNQARSDDQDLIKFVKEANEGENRLSSNRSNDSSSAESNDSSLAEWGRTLFSKDIPERNRDRSPQLQKCETCSHEFCSTINYRRHLRSHRKNLNLDKDSREKIWAELKGFWDKLSVDEAMKVVSLKDISLEGLSGPMIVKSLASLCRRPYLVPLLQDYQMAGYKLLDLVQAKPSSFPVSSEELFSILDEASEFTFLRAGSAESLQKYVIDGDALKIGLEARNLIASTSFLVELQLVKACLAGKKADVQKVYELLIEEEEAKQKNGTSSVMVMHTPYACAIVEKSVNTVSKEFRHHCRIDLTLLDLILIIVVSSLYLLVLHCRRLKKLRQKERAREKRMETISPPGDESPSAPTSSRDDEPACNPESSTEITDASSKRQEPFDIVNEKGDKCEDYHSGHPDVEDVSCEAGVPDCNPDWAEITDNDPPSHEPAQVVDDEVDLCKDHVRGCPELEDGRVAAEPDCYSDSAKITDKSIPSQLPVELDCNLKLAEVTEVSTVTQEPARIVDEERGLSKDLVSGCPNVEDGCRVHLVPVCSIPLTTKSDGHQRRSDIQGEASEVCALNPSSTPDQSDLADHSTVKQLPPLGRHDSGSQLLGQNSPDASRVDLDDEVQQTSLAGNDPPGRGPGETTNTPVDILAGGAPIESAWQFLRQRKIEEIQQTPVPANDPNAHEVIPNSAVDVLEEGTGIERLRRFLRQRGKAVAEAYVAGDPDVKLYNPPRFFNGR